MAKEFMEAVRLFGGLSLEYNDIQESDFAASAGSAYTPPERGDFRRIVGSRNIQILQDCPGVLETFQTSAGTLYLPANTVSQDTNDAGDGRLFFFKNSGTDDITIKDYLGTTLFVNKEGFTIIVVGNTSNTWDFYFIANDLYFDNTTLSWPISKSSIQKAIEYAFDSAEGKARYTLTLITNGTVVNNQWITYSDLTPDVWIQFPGACHLKEFTWANKQINRDFKLEFYLNSTAGVPFRTVTVTNRQYDYYSGWNDAFAAGDRLRIKYVDTGDNCEDLVCVLYVLFDR